MHNGRPAPHTICEEAFRTLAEVAAIEAVNVRWGKKIHRRVRRDRGGEKRLQMKPLGHLDDFPGRHTSQMKRARRACALLGRETVESDFSAFSAISAVNY